MEINGDLVIKPMVGSSSISTPKREDISGERRYPHLVGLFIRINLGGGVNLHFKKKTKMTSLTKMTTRSVVDTVYGRFFITSSVVDTVHGRFFITSRVVDTVHGRF